MSAAMAATLAALPAWAAWALAALLLLGAFFLLVGALGLLRLGDVFQRLHAPTKASTLGLGGLLLASMGLSWSRGEWGVHELLITLLVFITAPVAANLLAQAALHRRLPGSPEPTAANVPEAPAPAGLARTAQARDAQAPRA